ncbi:unnamed protein product [Owenia fusiformis]|uniref:Carboxylic ester hydrolase n=1 Tax=Owenia fusiformis TaxID=6347 RepID=A0A8J1U8X2_OWEFU|nr:unnamed protein product [Owenia fusiformis]
MRLDILALLLCISDAKYVTVNTTYGQLRGEVNTAIGEYPKGTLNNITSTQFLGVPFAKPPINRLRWKAPVEQDTWTGVKDALDYGNACWQAQRPNVDYSEDCLVLNIWIPGDVNQTALKNLNLSVMLYIHGGGFQTGTSSRYFGGFMSNDNNVVTVTVNYRLGVLGFFSTEDSTAEGNYGLLDNIMALQWVKNNIKNFGGNPNSITIYGESAGAAAVSHLMLSPMAEGLFHRGITQSGVATVYWGIARNYLKELSNLLGEKLDCPSRDSKALTNCLQDKDPKEVTNAAIQLDGEIQLNRNDTQSKYLPRIDGKVIIDEPLKVLQSGNFYPYDYMTGINSHEGWMLQNTVAIDLRNKTLEQGINFTDFDLLTQRWMRFLSHPDKRFEVSQAVKLVYDVYSSTADSIDRSKSYLDFLSDFVWIADNDRFAKLYSKKSTNIYNYYFSPEVSEYQRRIKFAKPAPDWVRASHADDISYVFGFAKYAKADNATDDERLFSDAVMKAWANFAKTGDPGEVAGKTWPRFSEDNPTYLDLTTPISNITQITNLLPRKMSLWLDFVWPMLDQPNDCKIQPTGNPVTRQPSSASTVRPLATTLIMVTLSLPMIL